ncbi:hypothetical protein AUJ14_03545 [Candidatus Micrarchaeota archaeon CG1_02_55_22]|nr:MAG: hypothetical protein AUJ14_03545 [Candidatus Micrarchaeota archaeon CG1_02_55_22]
MRRKEKPFLFNPPKASEKTEILMANALHEQVGRGCEHALKLIHEENPVLLGAYGPWTTTHEVSEQNGKTIATVTLHPKKQYMHYGSGPNVLKACLEHGLARASLHVGRAVNLTKTTPTDRKTDTVSFQLTLQRN